MTILQSSIVPSTGGYQISRSLRFNSADSAYLNRTFTTPTSGNIFTWSGWVKRGAIGSVQPLFTPSLAAGEGAVFNASNQISIAVNGALLLVSTAVYRDPSAWYHIVLVSDMGNATASLRFRVYVNGVEVTAWSTDARASYTSFPYWNKNTVVHYMGYSNAYPAYANGYMTEINFIDGQALTPSSFGQTNASTGVWSPIRYTGTYGTNGFYLNFSDNSNTTAATLGKDSSGNGNNWTPNNFSVTAGAGNDSLVDTPTSYGTDTGVGGEVRGNYATLNPLAVTYGTSFSNGNLKVLMNGANTSIPTSTIAISSGKWYAEMLVESTNSGTRTYPLFGICNPRTFGDPAFLGDTADEYSYSCDGFKTNNNVATNVGTTLTTNDIMMLAFDADNGRIWWGKNGTWIASGNPATGANAMYSSIPSATYVLALCGFVSTNATVNFGQRPFAYTAPSGFKALCTQNLPTPTIGATSTTQAGKYFNPVLYTGNGSTQSITGVGFQPDFVWIKNRGTATDHGLFDAIRGTTKRLSSNLTNAETTEVNSLTAFNSDGFSVGATQDFNQNTVGIVAWNWNAGGSNATNTSGTITSTVRANTTAGFSIVTYTGNGTNPSTVGHGLGVAPSFIIVKNRDSAAYDWNCYHISLGNTQYIALNTALAAASAVSLWNNTSPTSTIFTINHAAVNNNTNKYVAYCFAAVAGYSAFGSYTGNGSTDGPFIFTGFRPRFVMFKKSSGVDNWEIIDTSRNLFNVNNNGLAPNSADAEITNRGGDILSNGFKLRYANGVTNESGFTYIYAAFAESPFKFSLAR